MIDFTLIPAYEPVCQEKLEGVQSTGYLLRHKKSGARVMLLENEDENKVFGIGFRTTPKNSTGVAHIMEHTVLCGSREFPAKDPFVELVKGSMNTFLNAMTYPDKTVYPVASCNDKDFANLMHVYLDAVFYPNIYSREEIFRQEGWNYHLESEDGDITYNGVVYNEMKGAYSSPDDVLEREIMSSLFPDNTYHYDSGGDPECIPDLTYEEYLDFHRTYYHPSNSYIYLYGNMDFAERLNWMDEHYLSDFDRCEVCSRIDLQKPFEQPKVVIRSYPVSEEDEGEDRAFLTFNTVVGTSLDTRLSTAFAVLDYVLLDSPGAPLKEALLDAGIGEDVTGSYDSGIAQPVFSIIAKNAKEQDLQRFEGRIRSVLGDLIQKGLDPKAIQAAINIMEFKFREADYGTFPKGLMYGIDVFDSWLYADDMPFAYLKQLEDFDFLKHCPAGYFEDLIRTWILENPHASMVVLRPERGLTSRMENETAKKLKEYKESLSAEQISRIVENTRRLEEYQETPSTKEELEKIPMLTREDLKKEAAPLKNEFFEWDGVQTVYHDYRTNGIAYINLYFDASVLSQEDIPWFGVLKNVLGLVDTQHYSYADLTNEINRNTGGITPGVTLFPDSEDAGILMTALGIQIRTLYDQIPYSFSMVEEILLTSDLGQEKRLLEILRKLKVRLGTRLVEAGSATAATRALSGQSASFYMNDSINGIRFYRMVKDLEEHFEEKKELLKEKLRGILKQILDRNCLIVSFTGDRQQLGILENCVRSLEEKLQEQGAVRPSLRSRERFAPMKISLPGRESEGFKTPAKIQYVAKCGNFKEAGSSYSGVLRVLKVILSFDYLWNQIRVMGGAYGCGGTFLRSGDVSFSSYRDPHLERTLQVYDQIPGYLRNFSADERDMTKYVIGTVSDMDTPLNPSALGQRSMNAFMNGVTFEQLQQERNEVLSADCESVRRMAPVIEAALSKSCICAVGSERKLDEKRELFDSIESL